MTAPKVPPVPESQATAQELVAALVAGGVRHVVLAPGSRSAPLAYALASAEDAGWLELHVRADERVAGFLTLGLSVGLPAGECAAVVTTSGTAVANLHPAVLEADHARVPLVVVSADRPHEMRGTGANQTADQVRIFGTAVRGAWDLPAGMPRVAGQVRRALAAAHGVPSGTPGPVQLNVALREPLGPPQPWEPGPRPERRGPLPGSPGPEALAVPAGGRTVIVAGDRAGEEAALLARAGAFPLLAEPSSGVRDDPAAVPAYRVLLEDPALGGQIRRVLVLGHPTLTRPVSALLGRADVDVVVVDPTGPWYDVAGTAREIVGAVRVTGEPSAVDQAWTAAWHDAGHGVAAALLAGGSAGAEEPEAPEVPGAPGDADSDDAAAMTDLVRVADAVWRADGRPLVLGSSSTVRDLDLVARPREAGGAPPAGRAVLANRGLAGIDGTLATAIGWGIALREPVRVVVGDLTFLHDIGALVRGNLEREVDVQVVVLDDHGGGIFHTLEYGADGARARFERLFGTPQSADLAALAAALGASVRRVTPRELPQALAAPARGRDVLVVDLDRGRRRALDARARALVRAHRRAD